ncbi:PTS IIA-like nitrogen regulatory protein PtsN [Conchiformibius steedae DSM 2580]|uniref:PTS IIA-like nitrogen-regulatory protein PtsN n=2 Tax=Conchiformibius steedae TaxID=153493 RepID=A0A3P2A7T6_9NEIS|nr:PTS IIA-like nitrogen regulatory protein PtsN [Conchiformibius steedae]QMT33226.1 PTS IIA-like nitrogen regulatory protein PtsN [Conchiformibius steedae]RRD90946.1 PTS IIA-like nitrogen-regulatory protein PtsN [Conchiformibius steedae]URD67868.1 PTS IIA-like nitrogen regulatory protein PtsN [Conchiformibius steedae DSM 2580]
MKLIGEILPLERVVLDMDVSSKKRLFEEVGQLLQAQAGLAQAEVFDCLFAREKLGTTGLGQGVAVPHGRYSGVEQAVAAFVRTREPIDFDAPDGQAVSLVFVLLVPEHATGEHLEILSHLAERFADKNVRDALNRCQSADEARALLVA